MPYRASIIIPVLNESQTIVQALQRLQRYREQGCEIIVVDGGSNDGTAALAKPYADQLIVAAAGRARQMNRGAAVATASWLLFLHVDTQLPDKPGVLLNALPNSAVNNWCYCRVALSGSRRVYRMVEWLMNMRSRISSIPTGDQVQCFKRHFFIEHHGYNAIPLMEDIEIAKRLRAKNKPLRLPVTVTTSSRRWEQHGVLKTIVTMWVLRLLYWLGVSPVRLARWY